MMCKRRVRRAMALGMALVMLAAAAPINLGHAAMVTTDDFIEVESLAADRAKVVEFLAREDVRRQLMDMGVDPDEAAARAASLSDAEIQQIAGRLDKLPAGQSAFVSLLIAAGALLLLLIVTDVLGFTDIFPFIDSQREAE